VSSVVVPVPQVSVNDDRARLVRWLVREGDRVSAGEPVCVLETSKAAVDVEASAAGFVRHLAVEGAMVDVGSPLLAITSTPDAPVPSSPASAAATPAAAGSRRASKKAEMLAAKHGLSLDQIPAVGVVQESDVLAFIAGRERPVPKGLADDLVDSLYPVGRPQRVLIVGAGRAAIQVLDVLLRTPHQRAVAMLDDARSSWGKRVMGVEVLGGTDRAKALYDDGAFDAAVVTFNAKIADRTRAFEALDAAKIPLTNILDPTVLVHSNVQLGRGNILMAYARLGSCTVVGDNNFISAYVCLEHHNVLGSHCTFGPGVMTSGRVRIGDQIKFGTGIFVEPGVEIGDRSSVASGAILTTPVPPGSAVKVRPNYVIRPAE
jgi:acetyltransferase-like isoleucine patch superfamily enzyme